MAGAFNPGDILKEKYVIKNLLGTGAMGEVYLAEHINLKRLVAIKFMCRSHDDNPQANMRFQREALAAAKLDHPNICHILDYDSTDSGIFYIVMEYLQGDTLAKRLKDRGTIELPSVFRIMHDLCGALECAHEMGLVHRDIKPGNIILEQRRDRDDFVKLIDFGVVHIDIPDDNCESLTQNGQIQGTPQYLSPEQVLGETIDLRADLYSCGCMLFEMLEGHVPFKSDNYFVLINKHLILVPPHLTADIEKRAELDEIIQKLLQKDPAKRFQSARELSDALDRIEKGTYQLGELADSTEQSNSMVQGTNPLLSSGVYSEIHAIYNNPESNDKMISGVQSVLQQKQASQTEPQPSTLQPKEEPSIRAIVIARGIVIVLLVAAIINMFYDQKHNMKPNHSMQVLEQGASRVIVESGRSQTETLTKPVEEEHFVLTDAALHAYAKQECRIAQDAQLFKDVKLQSGAESCLLGDYEDAFVIFEQVKDDYASNQHFMVMMLMDTFALKKYDDAISIIVSLFESDGAVSCNPVVRDVIYAMLEEDETFDKFLAALKKKDSPGVSENLAWLILMTPCEHYKKRFDELSILYRVNGSHNNLEWLDKAAREWQSWTDCKKYQPHVNQIMTEGFKSECPSGTDANANSPHCKLCYVNWNAQPASDNHL